MYFKTLHTRLCILCVLIICVPKITHAAILINEIAWMGNETSANDEWIELYNNGNADVALEGWVLSDGINLNVELAGTVGASEFAVLERTDDTSAPGAAFLIYTGALSNTGVTLALKRSDGAIEDQVAGGEDWKNIGGDNDTKETAQYTAGGWITADATPGAINATENTIEPELDENVSEDENDKGNSIVTSPASADNNGSKKVVSLVLPDVELALSIDAPDIVYVHQPFELSVEPSGLGKVIMDSLLYDWNFGDTTTKHNREVSHMYEYPGEYLVVVYGSYIRHEQRARHKITVLPVTFSITRTHEGDIQINNDAKYEVNISGYSIQGQKKITFPDDSLLLAGSTVTISKERLRVSAPDTVTLYDQEGAVVAKSENTEKEEDVAAATPPVVTAIISQNVSLSAPESDNFAFSSSDKVKKVQSDQIDIPQQQVATALEGASAIPRNTLPYLGLIGVISLALVGLYVGKIK